jgi:hypothetical protein
MALSMDEQRMLAEIERRLTAEDPGLAIRLSSFKRPRKAAGLRTARGKVIGSFCAVILLAVIGLTVYAMLPLRAQGSKNQLKQQSTTSASVQPGQATAGARVSPAVGGSR